MQAAEYELVKERKKRSPQGGQKKKEPPKKPKNDRTPSSPGNDQQKKNKEKKKRPPEELVIGNTTYKLKKTRNPGRLLLVAAGNLSAKGKAGRQRDKTGRVLTVIGFLSTGQDW